MPLSVLTSILGVVLAALIAFCVWIAQTLITIKVVVIGVNGDNGLNSRVQRIERHVFRDERRTGDRREATA